MSGTELPEDSWLANASPCRISVGAPCRSCNCARILPWLSLNVVLAWCIDFKLHHMLRGLTVKLLVEVVANLTPYEGDFECALVALRGDSKMPPIRSLSLTGDAATHYMVERRLGRFLHGKWKHGGGEAALFGKVEQHVATPTVPEEHLPQLSLEILTAGADGLGPLRIPPAVRNKYLRDPVWSPEWHEQLQAFDEKHTALTPEAADGVALPRAG